MCKHYTHLFRHLFAEIILKGTVSQVFQIFFVLKTKSVLLDGADGFKNFCRSLVCK